MARWRIWLSLGGVIAAISNGWCADPPSLAQLRREAEAASLAGRWDAALSAYLKLAEAQPSLETRDAIRGVLRHLKQFQRQRDIHYQQFIRSLKPAEALNLYAEVLDKLQHWHAEPRLAQPKLLVEAGRQELLRALDDPAFCQRHLAPVNPAKLAQVRQVLASDYFRRDIANSKDARALAFELIQFVGDRLAVNSAGAIIGELISGACASVDEFTLYLQPTNEVLSPVDPIQELLAYGLLIRPGPDGLIIDGLVSGSWAAEQTSLRKGDRLLKWNGVALPAGPRDLAQAARLAGPAGHELELRTELTQQVGQLQLPVPLPTVYAVSLLTMRDAVGYLRVGHFRETTPRELDEAVHLLKMRGARVLIVDLRGNSGGSFPAAVQTAQRLLPSGIITTTQGQSPEFAHRVFSSDAGMMAHALPVVLLVDGRTMSAAEVVAAAWKDHQRAVLVGMPTFGKGAIQAKMKLTSLDQPGQPKRSGSVLLTVAQALSPNGHAISGLGVVPHFLEPDPVRQLDLAFSKALELIYDE